MVVMSFQCFMYLLMSVVVSFDLRVQPSPHDASHTINEN